MTASGALTLTITAHKTRIVMKKQTITVSVESTPGPLEVYSVAAQAGDGPKSEAHDDWFPLETAQEVAKEMRQASPNTTVNLNLNPTDQ